MLLPCGGSWEAVVKLVLTSEKLSPHFSSLARTQSLLFTEQNLWRCEHWEGFIRPVLLNHEHTSECAGRLLQAPIPGSDPLSF